MPVVPELRKSIVIMLLAALAAGAAVAAGEQDSWLTRSGFYRISFQSELDPIVINTMHNWVLHVETADGTPVEGATIAMTGGMPLHNHGLPSSPKVTRSLGAGDYLLQGVRFHMNGYWELQLTITAAGRRDTVVVPLTL